MPGGNCICGRLLSTLQPRRVSHSRRHAALPVLHFANKGDETQSSPWFYLLRTSVCHGIRGLTFDSPLRHFHFVRTLNLYLFMILQAVSRNPTILHPPMASTIGRPRKCLLFLREGSPSSYSIVVKISGKKLSNYS